MMPREAERVVSGVTFDSSERANMAIIFPQILRIMEERIGCTTRYGVDTV
jgi:hypothetical protein